METLSKYLNESIWGNLGIDSAAIDAWIEIYNDQLNSFNNRKIFPVRCAPAEREGQKVIIRGPMVIWDERLVENGYIPDYINIHQKNRWGEGSTLELCIMCDSLKSIRGISHDAINGLVKFVKNRDFEDWNSISNISTLIIDLNKCKTNFSRLKTSQANDLSLVVDGINSSNVKVLNAISGCTFSGVSGVSLRGDLRGSENKLKPFLQNNIFERGYGAANLNLERLKVSDLDFLSDPNPRTFVNVYVNVVNVNPAWKTDPSVAKNMFDMFRNLPQFDTIYACMSKEDKKLIGQTFNKYYQEGIIPGNVQGYIGTRTY